MVGGGRGEEGGQLCQDLTEATLDMLARYSYSSLSCLPTRWVCLWSASEGGLNVLRQVFWGGLPAVGRTQ